ncbi:MAG: SCO family protein [Rubellimicrobium sp.]|nr:SCO family protein [Rubellimicrobium sp.]
MERSTTWAVVGGAVLGLGVIATVAMVMLNQRPTDFGCSGAAVGGSLGGPFTLVDENGATVTDRDVITAPTVVYFGYTFCPDVCPMDSQRNAFALEDLEDRGILANALFITIDPERDTPEVVRDFTDSFHDRMLGLTGSPEQVREAAQAYRVFYSRDDSGGNSDFYLMNHSTFTYFATPDSGFVDVFSRETTPEQMADRIACFVEAGA